MSTDEKPETLSKTDPDFYSKLGKRGGAVRKASGADYSAIAKASHPRAEYKGGRPRGGKNRPKEERE